MTLICFRKRALFHPHGGDAREGVDALRVPVHLQGQDVPPLHRRRVRQRQGVVRHRGRRPGRGHHRPVGRLRLQQHQVLHPRRGPGAIVGAAAAGIETAAAATGAQAEVVIT